MSMETPKKSVEQQLAEAEIQKQYVESSLETLNAKIESLKAELKITAETAKMVPEHQVNQIIEQGGTLEEVNQRTKEKDRQIEEVKESTLSDNSGERSSIEMNAPTEALRSTAHNLIELINKRNLEESSVVVGEGFKEVIDEITNKKILPLKNWII